MDWKNNFVSDAQFGFMSSRSTVDAIFIFNDVVMKKIGCIVVLSKKCLAA